MLASAVKRGLFAARPPKPVTVRLGLKLSVTGPSFRYEDRLAGRLIAKARAGNVEADALLREIARAKLPSLPPNLAAYVDWLLTNPKLPQRRGRPRKFYDRDVHLYFTVQKVCHQFKLKPTRNPSTSRPSGTSVVAAALKALGVRLSEKDIARAWAKVHHSIPANRSR